MGAIRHRGLLSGVRVVAIPHYDSELSDFVHCPAEFGRLAVFCWSEESRANTRWRYCLEELCPELLGGSLFGIFESQGGCATPRDPPPQFHV